MSGSVRGKNGDRTLRRALKKALPVLIALLALPAARDALAQRDGLAPVFKRKTSDDFERRERVERAEKRQQRAEEPEQDTKTVVASPSDIERVLRAALTSVNSTRTEILVRTGDWDHLAPAAESAQAMGLIKRKRAERGGSLKRTAALGASASTRRLVGAAPANARDPIESLAHSETLHIELQPGSAGY